MRALRGRARAVCCSVAELHLTALARLREASRTWRYVQWWAARAALAGRHGGAVWGVVVGWGVGAEAGRADRLMSACHEAWAEARRLEAGARREEGGRRLAVEEWSSDEEEEEGDRAPPGGG